MNCSTTVLNSKRVKTIEEFTKGVLSTASSHEQWQAQLEQDKAIFAGIKNLIDQGAFKDASMVAVLEEELTQGEESLCTLH